MAGDGEDEVVMIGRHDLDIGAEALPEGAQPRHGVGVRIFRRREDAPAVLEQVGEACLGAGIFCAGDGMGGHEMHAGGDVRLHLAEDRGLDRADVADCRAGLQRARNLGGDRAAGADRNAQDDEIGAADGLGRGGGVAVAQTERARLLQSGGASRLDGDLVGEPLGARGTRDRRADQPDADERETADLSHHAAPARKSAKAETARRFASSVPIVIRSAFGKP
jgi:hypothetical protein